MMFMTMLVILLLRSWLVGLQLPYLVMVMRLILFMAILIDDDDIIDDQADCGHGNGDLGLLGRTSVAYRKL